MNLTHYSKQLLPMPFFISFRPTLQAYLCANNLKNRIWADAKTQFFRFGYIECSARCPKTYEKTLQSTLE